jgi:hypothetical protein
MQEIQVGQTIYEFPDNMSDNEIRKAIMADVGAPSNPIAAHYTGGRGSTDDGGDRRSFVDSVVSGVIDPFVGAARLVGGSLAGAAPDPMVIPQSVQGSYQRAGPGNHVEPIAHAREDSIQQERGPAAGSFDPGRMVGNVLSPANLVPGKVATSIAGKGLGLGRKVLGGAAGGAVGGAMVPTRDQGMGALIGGATGGILSGVTGAASRVLSPKISPSMRLLADEGVAPTPGRHLGSMASNLEDKARSIPITGHLIDRTTRQSFSDYNTAAFKRVLKPIGLDVDKDFGVGPQAIGKLHDTLNDKFTEVYGKLRGFRDPTFAKEMLNNVMSKARDDLPPDVAQEFAEDITAIVANRLPKDRLITGRALQSIPEDLVSLKVRLSKAEGFGARGASAQIPHVDRVISAFDRMIERNNPEPLVREASNVRKAWKAFKAVQRASSGKDGPFSPAQHMMGIRSTDKSKGQGRFREGRMPNQDLAQAGTDLLPSKYPDSGTAGRSALTGVALGGAGVGTYTGAMDPIALPIILGGGALPYLPGVPRALTYAMTQRPSWADPFARNFNVGGLMAAPGVGGYAGREGQ